MNRRLSIFILGIGLFLFCFSSGVHAADFRTSYTIEYFIQESDPQEYVKAAYTIALTNLQPDLIIKKYTLSFPRSFGIDSIAANDDRGTINPQIQENDRMVELSFELNKPAPGLNEINTLYLTFRQKNIFRSNGSVWELLIPTLENKEGDSQSITVYLPPGQHRKLSLSKPLPSLITFDKVVWNGNTGKSIYAVFGTEQRYSLNLAYHLTNPNVYKAYTDVAFPPDTLYQKIVVSSIIPPPDLVYSDNDGNYMGRYNLNANEEKLITFSGEASIYTVPRSEYKDYIQSTFEEQKRTLFDVQPLWQLPKETPITSHDIKDHFDYTVQTLKYNFKRVITGNSRMGATQALAYPDQAVCTEFSDLLIASARQRGIYIREMQGFAFASEQELRPVQQNADVLHSWVEYYDTTQNIWIPVDPTWQSTSGIDYFNSFDFNHIVFAIHGKKADYPYPAGSYKSGPLGKDVRIEPTVATQTESKAFSATFSSFPLPASADLFTIDLTVKNTGNINVWNTPISVRAENATINQAEQTIAHLLPGEIKKMSFTFKPKTSFLYQTVIFSAQTKEGSIAQQIVQVPTFLSPFKGALLPLSLIGGGVIILVILLQKRKRKE